METIYTVRNNIRKHINNESSYIPGASAVNFDYITRQRIFDVIYLNYMGGVLWKRRRIAGESAM
jgi:hypothetical protein